MLYEIKRFYILYQLFHTKSLIYRQSSKKRGKIPRTIILPTSTNSYFVVDYRHSAFIADFKANRIAKFPDVRVNPAIFSDHLHGYFISENLDLVHLNHFFHQPFLELFPCSFILNERRRTYLAHHVKVPDNIFNENTMFPHQVPAQLHRIFQLLYQS